ncbi:MAG: ADP-ribosylglycohydrolase family protein [Spirulina sp. SIO3F2]|nr:ADP-ribosylglycohydrolase family protein [Spirulina sp. SIO3F2]
MTQPSLNDRLAGGLVGLLVGDALGVPYEFHPPETIPTSELIEYKPPPGFARSHRGVPPGTWSDDGAQALCLLASLLDCERLDLADFATRLLRWCDEGYLAVDGVVFDIGVTTGAALSAVRQGVAPGEAGRDGVYANGNGSLMRVLPLALWHQGTDAQLVQAAQLQSCVTHRHLRSQVCCALYCLWARRILEAHPEPWQAAVQTLRHIYAEDEAATEELEWSIRPDDPPEGKGSGYVVDCLRSARWACQHKTYAEVVRSAIRLGNDTDTTACVAGGIAGLRGGIEAIPLQWREALRGQDLLAPLLERLLMVRG